MKENAKLETLGWSCLLFLACPRQVLWERGYDLLLALRGQTPTSVAVVLPTSALSPLPTFPCWPPFSLSHLLLHLLSSLNHIPQFVPLNWKGGDCVELLRVPACLCRKLHPWPWESFASFIPISFPSFSLLPMLLGILYLVFYMSLGTRRDLHSLLALKGLWHSPAHLCRRHGEPLALLNAVGHGHSFTPSIKGVRVGSYFQ